MLEEKVEALTKATVALRQAVEANTAALGGEAGKKPATKKPAAADDDDEDEGAKKKPATKKPATKKPAVEEPEHDMDETNAMFRKAAKIDRPACLKYLKKRDCADLAELLTQPELYDAAFEFAEAIVDAPEEEDEDDV